MSKAIILCSSPNKNGKTNTVAKMVGEMMQKQGIEVVIHDVANLKYKTNGCIACMSCQKSDKFECAVKDEATPILEELPSANYVIYTTPVYFMGPCAQLKIFLDRTFSLYKVPHDDTPPVIAFKDFKMGLISTAGGDYDSGLDLTNKTFEIMGEFGNIPYESLLIPFTEKIEDMQKDPDVVNKAEKFVKALLSK